MSACVSCVAQGWPGCDLAGETRSLSSSRVVGGERAKVAKSARFIEFCYYKPCLAKAKGWHEINGPGD